MFLSQLNVKIGKIDIGGGFKKTLVNIGKIGKMGKNFI